MKLDLLLAHCGDLGIEVDWEDLGPRRRGKYLDDENRIVLNLGLTRVQAVSTLAHELGHAFFRHRGTSMANERRAWEFGASLVIEPEDYAAAEALVGCHTGALADALGCTPKLVEAWQRWYRRRYPVEQRRIGVLDLREHLDEFSGDDFSLDDLGDDLGCDRRGVDLPGHDRSPLR